MFAKVLKKKGFHTPEAALKFLYPTYSDISETYKQIPDMPIAVERIRKAIDNKEPICIHGDYDVDGITSTVILLETLSFLGTEASYHIPHRVKEGYGLNVSTIIRLCKKESPLLITVDCGITEVIGIAKAVELGSDVIVVDHHQEVTEKPQALAFITPFNDLNTEFSGAGLAFKLAQALVEGKENSKEFLFSLLDVTTLGTIIDVAPLTGENRAITSLGIRQLDYPTRIGLQELYKVANCSAPLSDFDLGFAIGPRLNAPGRMDHADIAVQLLRSKNRQEAEELSEIINQLNEDRKKFTVDFTEFSETIIDTDFCAIIAVCPKESPFKGLVGIAGIVASRLSDKYGKPAFVLSEKESGIIGGSARSFDNFSLIEALNYCKNTLKGFGGHHVAAGLSLERRNLDKFKNKLAEYMETVPIKVAPRKKQFAINIKLEELRLSLFEELKALQPCGTKNMMPLWNTRVKITKKPTAIGKKKNHLVLFVSDDTTTYRCLGWRMVNKYKDKLQEGLEIDLAYEFSVNTWNNQTKLELIIKEINFID